MFVLTVLAVFLTALLLSLRGKEDLTDTLPVTAGSLIPVLYLCAFFRGLWFIDILSAGLIIGTGVFLWKKKVFETKKPDREDLIFSGVRIGVILLVMILITVSQLPRLADWWDDINFWATDVKALYFLNGFPGKYGNAAPEFGDYPPGIQLFKWFFLHMSPKKYIEGLGFGGYLCMNYLFLLPLLRPLCLKIKGKNPVISGLLFFVSSLLLILFPTVANVVCFQGTCADVTMGILYGILLLGIWDREGHGELFYHVRIAVYGSVLVLTKSVGIEWAVFAFLFYLLIRRKEISKGQGSSFYRWGAWGAVLLTEASWMIFCLLNRRISKLTSSGVRIASSGNADLSYYAKEKARFFLEGFSFQPMHTDHTIGLDLSALALLLIITGAVFLFAFLKILSGKERNRLLLFTFITAFAAYGIIFLGHITIFATETQYASSEVMAISVSRYGAPFTIGMMILMMGIAMIRLRESVKVMLLCGLFLLLTCDFQGAVKGLWGYRKDVESVRTARDEMIEEKARSFADKAAEHPELYGKRILYLQDEESPHWVHNAYLNLEVSPAAVVYESPGLSAGTEELYKLIRDSHASYVYADKDAVSEERMKEIFPDDFAYGTFLMLE